MIGRESGANFMDQPQIQAKQNQSYGGAQSKIILS